MNKFCRFFAFIVLTVALTGCSKFDRLRFTANPLTDASGKTARVRVTANIPEVFAIPGGFCVSPYPQHSYVANGNNPPFFGGDYEERIEKSLGMPEIPIQAFDIRKGPYISQEYRVKAGEPILFYIPNMDGEFDSFFWGLDEVESLDRSTFAFSFVPEAGRDYQIIFNEEMNFLPTSHNPLANNGYTVRFADITNGKINTLNGNIRRVYSCETEIRGQLKRNGN